MKLARVNDHDFLAYALEGEEHNFPSFWNVTILKDNVNPADYPGLEIVHIPDTHYQNSRDRKLEAEHILTYTDLSNAYNLIKLKQLNKSRSIREAVITKYIEVLDYVTLHN